MPIPARVCYRHPAMRSLLPCGIALSLLLGPVAQAAEFIGSESCKVCHPAAYEIWKDSQHAQAAAPLSEKQQKDPRCLSCHSPEGTKGFAHVGCETCHGGGQYYKPSYVMKDKELSRAVGLVDPSEKMCLRCHDATAPSLTPFKFAEKLKAIDHWTVERAARAAKDEKAADKPAKGEKPDAKKDPKKGKSSP